MNAFKMLLIIIFANLMYNTVLLKHIMCPPHCACDVFRQFRRARCHNNKLVTVEANIPVQVQLLDLSYNLIYELQNHIFVDMELTKLHLLNLSNNKIRSIHMNAFMDMDILKTLDLSHNNLEYLLHNWFWNTPILQELYLQGNNLRRLQDGPIIESTSIRQLDLSSCSLLYIHHDTFSNLSKLEILDLSKNYLIQLHVNVIKPCLNLKLLKLENNSLHCNNVTDVLADYCIRKEINFKNPCVKSEVKTNKSEKMIAASDDQPEMSNSWIYDYEELNTREMHDDKGHSNFCTTTLTQKGVLLDVIELSPILVISITFTVGLGLGLVIACGLHSKPHKKRKKIELKRARRVSDIYIALADAYEVSETTPVAVRRSII